MSDTETRPRLFIENEVLDELHAYREALAVRFDYDIHKLCEYYREQTKELEAQGVPFVSKEDLEKRK